MALVDAVLDLGGDIHESAPGWQIEDEFVAIRFHGIWKLIEPTAICHPELVEGSDALLYPISWANTKS
jgi:hypothetical protein